MTTRLSQIAKIISRLQQLKLKTVNVNTVYAIDANIIFFKALKSIPKYIAWIVTVAPKLDPARLLEINDFPFPEYDNQMHKKLIEIERKEFPGLITLPVNTLQEFITEKKDAVVASLGSGAMELERQVVTKLKKSGFDGHVTFFAIDVSQSAIDTAKENLKELEIVMTEVSEVDDRTIESVRKSSNVFQVIFCKKDIFHLNDTIRLSKLDAVYHTLFKHHLTQAQKVYWTQ